MAEIVNLNRARKARARAAALATAEANRARFGRSKAERDAEAADKARREAVLDGAKRDAPSGTSSSGPEGQAGERLGDRP